MADDDDLFSRDGPGGAERAWDEHDWERFLQQQDQKTERYMELLDRYFEHPDRDQLIAREMGWHHLLDENGRDWGEDVDALFSREEAAGALRATDPGDGSGGGGADDEDDDPAATPRGPAEPHPLYQQAHALAVGIDGLFTAREKQRGGELPPAAARLTAHVTLASVKLAAALSDDDVDELGMTIAYLKRALKAVTVALEAAGDCEEQRLLEPERVAFLRAGIFGVRDGIVTLMGELRGEWRRRHGSGR